MEKQTLTAPIASAYLGCGLLVSYISMTTKTQASITTKADTFRIGMYVGDETNTCQLILTPVCKISDEHAVEVAKIMGDTPDNEKLVKSALSNRDKGAYMVSRMAEGKMPFWTSVTDYLRPLGYDCGYGNIPSLISAGIAVDGTLLKS